jgi:hypothetical protein
MAGESPRRSVRRASDLVQTILSAKILSLLITADALKDDSQTTVEWTMRKRD